MGHLTEYQKENVIPHLGCGAIVGLDDGTVHLLGVAVTNGWQDRFLQA